MNNIETNICDAIDILIQRALETADFDKTISANIVECTDPSVGKYKVKYEDGIFEATTDNNTISYAAGTEVYILVPAGDFSKNKKILGTVKNLGTTPLNIEELEVLKYEKIGANIILYSNEFSMSSYKTENKVIYDADSANNELLINPELASLYLAQAKNLIVSAAFKTAIPAENRNYGNYGIKFELEFKDDEVYTNTLTFDVNSMLGQPYNLVKYTTQTINFAIDANKFVRIKKITLFTENFIYQDETKPDDIFIGGIELFGAGEIDTALQSKYFVILETPNGDIFPQDGSIDILPIAATVYLNNAKVSNPKDHNLEFYWGIENALIDTGEKTYCQYLGQGWNCVNNSISINNNQVYWSAEGATKKILRDWCLNKSTKIKCACKYGDMILTKEIALNNLYDPCTIIIDSLKGTQFYQGNGYTHLVCSVDNPLDKNKNLVYNYKWIKTNSSNTSEVIETKEENELYNSALELKTNLTTIFESKDSNIVKYRLDKYTIGNTLIEQYISNKYPGKEFTYGFIFDEVSAYLVNTSRMRVVEDMIYNVQAKTLGEADTIKCAVSLENGTYLGTGNIVLKNSKDTPPGMRVIIYNGSQIFQYDEAGMAPDVEPPTLSFILLDELGNEIKITDVNNIKWFVPNQDSMIQYVSAEGAYGENGYQVYQGFEVLRYELKPTYNYDNTNNTIRLEVVYDGIVVQGQTNFSFVKQGDVGTNGTNYVCRIVPNTAIGDETPTWPVLTLTDTSATMNYIINGISNDATANKKWFRAELWKDGILVEDSYTVVWSILNNRYYTDANGVTADYSILKGVSTNGDFTLNNVSGLGIANSAHTAKAVITYQGDDYIATLPIDVRKVFNNDYIVDINDGFRTVIYDSDGAHPKYDVEPFAFDVKKNVDGNFISIIDNLEAQGITYDWAVTGSIYNKTTKETNYKVEYLTTKDSSKKKVFYQPVEQYDGRCVNIGVIVYVYKDGEQLGQYLHPVHFMLNRFGFAHLNGWDGNSITLNEEGGFILSPQVGAGKKNSNNEFTGLLMGVVEDPNDADGEKVGLLGYKAGQRSIFLDAETGKAEFGLDTQGKIILDPSNNTAQIKSGNYSTSSKTGMLIDLTTPEIKFGSGNFSVDKNGVLNATNANITGVINAGKGGTIAGWNIGDTALTKGNTAVSSGGTYAFYAGAESNGARPFSVTHAGKLTATGASISGHIEASSGKIASITLEPNQGIYYSTNATNGWGLWATTAHDNIVIHAGANNSNIGGAPFRVYNSGEVHCTNLHASGGSFNGINTTSLNVLVGETWTPIKPVELIYVSSIGMETSGGEYTGRVEAHKKKIVTLAFDDASYSAWDYANINLIL